MVGREVIMRKCIAGADSFLGIEDKHPLKEINRCTMSATSRQSFEHCTYPPGRHS